MMELPLLFFLIKLFLSPLIKGARGLLGKEKVWKKSLAWLVRVERASRRKPKAVARNEAISEANMLYIATIYSISRGWMPCCAQNLRARRRLRRRSDSWLISPLPAPAPVSPLVLHVPLTIASVHVFPLLSDALPRPPSPPTP